MQELAIMLILGIIKSSVKNPAKAAEMKADLLHIRDSINELYPHE